MYATDELTTHITRMCNVCGDRYDEPRHCASVICDTCTMVILRQNLITPHVWPDDTEGGVITFAP